VASGAVHSFDLKDSLKMAHAGTCSRIIFVINCVLLSALVGW
jgi:hypothetical protein